MLCDQYNILLFIVDGGLTPKANLADIDYIKKTKARYHTRLLQLREEKFLAKRQAVSNADGVVCVNVQPPSKIGTIACLNAVIEAWRGNDFSTAKERFSATRMLTKAQGEQLGWTPEQAFADYVPTEEETNFAQSIIPPSVENKPKRRWDTHVFKCIQKKCGRKSYFGFADEQVPRYCEVHKLEGMVELSAWTPSFKPHPQGVPRYVPTSRGLPTSMRSTEQHNRVEVEGELVQGDTLQDDTVQADPDFITTPTSQLAKEGKARAAKGKNTQKGKGKAIVSKNNTPASAGLILQFLSPPSQHTADEKVALSQEQLNAQVHTTTLPPLLQPHHTGDLIPSTVEYLSELWWKEGEISQIEGVSIGHQELSRLLNFRGLGAFLNDNIIDGFCHLLNDKEGDFWIFPSLMYGKFLQGDPMDRWVARAVTRWDKKGKGHIPRYIMLPFAVDLHYRLVVWDTHRDKVVHLEPLDPNPTSADQTWIEFCVNICAKWRTVWSMHELPPPSYGFDVPELPAQMDGVSCGIYVLVYMLMFANNWVCVLFPPEGTNVFRIVVARLLGLKKMPFNQLKKCLSAEAPSIEEES